jgi:hypothetical protein
VGIFQHSFLYRVSQASSYFESQHFTTGYGRLYRLGPASSLSLQTALPFIHSDQECLNQAALVPGVQVMTDASMCALIIQVAVVFYCHRRCTIQTSIAVVGYQSWHSWSPYHWTNSMDNSCGTAPSQSPVICIYEAFLHHTASSCALRVSTGVLGTPSRRV